MYRNVHTSSNEGTGIGIEGEPPKLLKLLTDASIGTIVLEHRDHATQFGLNSIEKLMQMQGHRGEVIFASETDKDPGDDFIAVIPSMASCISD